MILWNITNQWKNNFPHPKVSFIYSVVKPKNIFASSCQIICRLIVLNEWLKLCSVAVFVVAFLIFMWCSVLSNIKVNTHFEAQVSSWVPTLTTRLLAFLLPQQPIWSPVLNVSLNIDKQTWTRIQIQ